MSEIMNLQKLVQMAIENDADFEVIHGVTTHKDKTVRAQMILNLQDVPSLHIAFGDKKHGQRVTLVALAGNRKINVKLADVIRALEANKVGQQWQRSLTSVETPLFNMEPTGDGKVRITGRINPTSYLVTNDDGSEVTMQVTVTNFMLSKGQVVEVEPTLFNVSAPDSEEIQAKMEAGEEMTFTGNYVFPDAIVVVA